MLIAWLLFACVYTEVGTASNPPYCDPRTLAVGQVRARRIYCSEERLGGDARAGDWLIENAVARFGVRDVYAPLTRLEGAGATLVDAMLVGGGDLLVEATPIFGDQGVDDAGFATASVEPFTDADEAGLIVSGALSDGHEVELRYVLAADSRTLRLEGADGLLLAPLAGSALVGQTVEAASDALDPGDALLLGIPGQSEDLGGWVRFVGADAISIGAREDVAATLWPDGLEVSGTSDGTWVEARGSSGLLARIPVLEGSFSGRVPLETAALVAIAEGCAEGDSAVPGQDLALNLGDCGELLGRIADETGRDIPGTLWWGGQAWPLPAGGASVPVGPLTSDVLVSAGPAYESTTLAEVPPGSTLSLNLRRAVPSGSFLIELGQTAWPDRSTRALSEDLLVAALGRGAQASVLSANDEVATADIDDHSALDPQGGTRADSDAGSVLVWPWTQDSRVAAHGAAPWPLLSPTDLLATLDQGLISAVNADWLAAAPAPALWDPRPDGVMLSGLDDLRAYMAVLDADVPVAALAALTWLVDIPDAHSDVDINAAIVEERSVAGNGPYIELSVDGAGIGELATRQPAMTVDVRVWAPAWIPLSEVILYSTGGVALARWPTGKDGSLRLDRSLLVSPGDWVIAVVRGESTNPPLLDAPAWAVSSPVWIGR